MERLANMINTLKNEGKTVITITHDIEFVVNHFERVIVMANRQVIADEHKRDIFWNLDVLEQAMLKQPHISRIYHALNIGGEKILNISELTQQLKRLSVKDE